MRFVLLAAGSALPGQVRVVIPGGGLAAREGSTFEWTPCRDAPARVQVFYDAAVLTGLPSGLVQSVALRRDGASTAPTVPHGFLTSVWLASQGVPDAARASRDSFVANQGTDWTLVMDRVLVQWPALPAPTPPPAPFAVVLPFAVPFPYAGSQNLLVQFDTEAPSAQTESFPWWIDAEGSYPLGVPGTVAYGGAACPADHLLYATAPALNLHDVLELEVLPRTGFQALPVLAVCGASTTAWGGLPLPFDLTPVGAAGCSLHTDWVVWRAGRTDPRRADGRCVLPFGVPPHDPALAGGVLPAQALVFDPSFNALGVRASRRASVQLGSFVPACPALLLAAYGSGPPGDRPALALREHPVLELEVR